jgi:hypothetical protein
MSPNAQVSATALEFFGTDGDSNVKLTAVPGGIVVMTSGDGSTVQIQGVATPVVANGVATKGYVDSIATGISWKQSVRAATASPRDFATGFMESSIIDGVTLLEGDRILIKNQTIGVENGIYLVNLTGPPTRTADMALAYEAGASAVLVEEGNTLADTGWVCSNNQNDDVVGSHHLVFIQFAGSNTTKAGDGITVVGHIVSVDQTVVRTSGVQSISGVKTLTDQTVLNAGLLQTSGSSNISGGSVTFNDSVPLNVGTGLDLVLSHDGSNSSIVSKTGNLLIDNTSVTGTTVLQTGTDTNQTSVQIKNNSGTSILTVSGNSDVGITGPLNLTGATVSASGIVSVQNVTDSSSELNGCLVLAGGLGVSKNVNMKGDVKVTSTTASTNSSSGCLVLTGGLGVTGAINGTTLNTSGAVSISGHLTGTSVTTSGIMLAQNQTESNSSSDGCLVLSGGLGVAKNVNVAGIVKVANATASTNSSSGCLVLSGGMGISGAVHGTSITLSGDSTALTHISTSDERKKKEIAPVISSVELINKLKPVSYKWKKETSSEIKYGLIAQDVRKLLPDAVYEDAQGFLSLDYNCVWTMLLKSHQELMESHQELIESHQELIEAHQELSEKVNKMESSKVAQVATSKKAPNKRYRPALRNVKPKV